MFQEADDFVQRQRLPLASLDMWVIKDLTQADLSVEGLVIWVLLRRDLPESSKLLDGFVLFLSSSLLNVALIEFLNDDMGENLRQQLVNFNEQVDNPLGVNFELQKGPQILDDFDAVPMPADAVVLLLLLRVDLTWYLQIHCQSVRKGSIVFDFVVVQRLLSEILKFVQKLLVKVLCIQAFLRADAVVSAPFLNDLVTELAIVDDEPLDMHLGRLILLTVFGLQNFQKYFDRIKT